VQLSRQVVPYLSTPYCGIQYISQQATTPKLWQEAQLEVIERELYSLEQQETISGVIDVIEPHRRAHGP
jgi:hypothetical protein